jgi:hypothetical protein
MREAREKKKRHTSVVQTKRVTFVKHATTESNKNESFHIRSSLCQQENRASKKENSCHIDRKKIKNKIWIRRTADPQLDKQTAAATPM